ncbi:glycosyltransferase family protein [Glutamicibacter protophormiae]|uniref:hypothetical protein n=1 Tax=Glutamicibacter protophormiae TaxID=37930 RepID=UPI00195711EB|nr:hypothetical protein [Glutamicibacter protophormiae]QRQ79980.1 hypothetical protein JQN66_07175 [Glutamicibacter protophormiae]
MQLRTDELTYQLTRELGAQTTSLMVRLSFEVSPAEDASKIGVLYFRFQDEYGRDVAPAGKFGLSQVYGPFRYVHHDAGITDYVIDLPVPEGATRCAIGLARTRRRFAGEVNLTVLEQGPNLETDFSTVSPQHPLPVEGMRKTFPVSPGNHYDLVIPVAGAADGKSLLLFTFLDANGEMILPDEQLSIHPKLGPYQYLTVQQPSMVSVTIPEGCVELILRGQYWSGGELRLEGAPELVPGSQTGAASDQTVAGWVDGLQDTDDVIILHSTAGPISSQNKLLLRSNRTALQLARHGWKVIYSPFTAPVRDDRLIGDNLLQLAPGEIPGVVDRLVAKDLRGRRVLHCSSFADMAMLSVQNRLQNHGWKTIYEIRDDMEEFKRVGFSKWYSPALELRYAQQAEGIVATSPRLRDKISVVTGRSDVHYLPNAAPDELVAATAAMRSMAHWREHRIRPLVGYLGHLTGSWFDWPKFLKVARQHPDIDFELIGHGMPKHTRLPMNVVNLGPMSHEDCLPHVARWTVGLIPFIESRLTYGVDPNKVYEYVAMGLRTVSAPMGDLERIPGVAVYRSAEEFSARLLDAVQFEPDESFYSDCTEFLSTANWSYRVSQVKGFLEGMYA